MNNNDTEKIGNTYQPNESESTTTTSTSKPIPKNSSWLHSFIPLCPFERYKNSRTQPPPDNNTAFNHDSVDQLQATTTPVAPSTTIFGIKKPSFHCERKKWRDEQKQQRCLRDRFCEKRRQNEDNEWECQRQQQQQHRQQDNDSDSILQSCSNKRFCRQQSSQHCTSGISFFKVPCTQSIFSQSTTSVVSSTSTTSSSSSNSSNNENNRNTTIEQQRVQSSFKSTGTTTTLPSGEFCISQQQSSVATNNFYMNNRKGNEDSDSD